MSCYPLWKLITNIWKIMIKIKNHHILHMSQKLPVNGFKWLKRHFSLMNTTSLNEWYERWTIFFWSCLIPWKITLPWQWLQFLPKRMKIEKLEKLVVNLHDKKECVVHIRNLKQTLNHWLILKKVLRVVMFNQKPWLKP